MNIDTFIIRAKQTKDFNAVSFFNEIKEYAKNNKISINETVSHFSVIYKNSSYKIKLLNFLKIAYPQKNTLENCINISKQRMRSTQEEMNRIYKKIEEQRPNIKHRPTKIKSKVGKLKIG